MHPLKARVENGRYVIDEKADLPDGTEVYLVPATDLGEEFADLDESELEAMHESIRQGVADAQAGRTVPTEELIAQLRSRQ